MEVITRTIKHAYSDKFSLRIFGDVHGGAAECAEDQLREEIKETASDRRNLWVSIGDIIDAISKGDKRFMMGGLADWITGDKGKMDDIIETERKWAVSMFTPIKSQGLAWGEGNHEVTIHQVHSDNVSAHMASDLDIPYGGYSYFLRLRFARNGRYHHWLLHMFHGSGAAQSEGARIMRLMRLVNDVQADIYGMGHLHGEASYKTTRLHLADNNRIRHTDIIAVMTASWLKTYAQGSSSYGEQKGYKPSTIGCPVIDFYPEDNYVELRQKIAH